MSTVYHHKIEFAKCPKCEGELQAASFDPDGLHENSTVICVNYCVSGKVKIATGTTHFEWD